MKDACGLVRRQVGFRPRIDASAKALVKIVVPLADRRLTWIKVQVNTSGYQGAGVGAPLHVELLASGVGAGHGQCPDSGAVVDGAHLSGLTFAIVYVAVIDRWAGTMG